MLSLIVGNGNGKALEQFHRAVAAWEQKNPAGERRALLAETLTPLMLEELLWGGDLFGRTRLVTGVRLCENADACALLVQSAQELHDSQTQFILFEESAPEALVTQARAAGTLVMLTQAPTVPTENPFAISNALAERDRRGVWLALMRARRAGVTDEDILPRLLWQVKALVLAGVASEQESGLKPFPYKKARAARAKWSDEDLQRLYGELVFLLPAQVAGECELDIALERTLLEFV